MDFGYTAEQEAVRREVRAFIAENITDEILAEMEELNEALASGPPAMTPRM